MEFINRVEIAGVVGSVRRQKVSDKTTATFSVMTERCYKDRNGNAVIESTWHLVTAWEGKGCQDLSSLKKGDWVHVIGRLRCRRYTDAAGIDRTQMDIVANNLEKGLRTEVLRSAPFGAGLFSLSSKEQ